MSPKQLTLLLSMSAFLSAPVIAQDRPTIPVPSMLEQVDTQIITEAEAADMPDLDRTAPPIEQVYEDIFPPAPTQSSGSFLDEVIKRWAPTQRYAVEPKDSIMIPVGQGLMNTFSTNLSMLTAKTNDETSTYEIDEGYLYITVNTKTPISLVLYQEGVLESQVSITLVPVPAPPTMVEINFELTQQMLTKAQEYKKETELNEKIYAQQQPSQANNPYQQFITSLLLPVARGDIPRGFAMAPSVPHNARFPCAMSIYHETKQRIVSAKHHIDVVHVVNDSDRTYAVKEEMCLSNYVKAVALFEKSYLQPGEESELYILRDIQSEQKEAQRNRRPRLIGE